MHYNNVNRHNRQNKHANYHRGQHMTQYWSDSLSPQWSRQAVITVSRSTWMTIKINGVATDLFYTGVIAHPGFLFLNQGLKSLI